MSFVARHGLLLLFGFVLVVQLGIPLPVAPVLVPLGAVAGMRGHSLFVPFAACVAACLIADSVWYVLGRRQGTRILRLLCRISLEPDSCVRRTETVLAGRGAPALLYSKFVPGLATVAPPVAGLVRMPVLRFLIWDAAGSALWAGAYLGLGWLFRGEAHAIVAFAAALGGRLVAAAAVVVAGWLGWKYVQRERFLRQIRVDRISPLELRERLDAGHEITVVDLRHPSDVAAREATLPGAVRVPPDAIETHLASIPMGREIVLFCT